MPSFTLTGPAAADTFDLTEGDLTGSITSLLSWSVSKRTRRGGRADGMEVITLDNGALAVQVVPTRGMGLWRASYRGDALGWDSPVRDGPVHPKFVRLEDRGGLGWLDGFDELMVRCGLAHNGPPFETVAADGRRTMHPLHGRIANIPASRVEVQVEGGPDGWTITLDGEVAESTLFHPQLVLATRIGTKAGSNRLTVRDTITNHSDRPGEFQLLYHWNLGPPYLGAGSTFHAPIEALSPRDARAAAGIATYATYGPPEPGFAEQVYLAHLVGAGPEGATLALLADPTRSRAVVLRFRRDQLPCFTLWKNTGGTHDGYVTGLEPGTNFPHPKAYEAAHHRVVPLAPGATYAAETTLEVLDTPEGVAAAIAEVEALQAARPPTVHPRPTEPFAPEG